MAAKNANTPAGLALPAESTAAPLLPSLVQTPVLTTSPQHPGTTSLTRPVGRAPAPKPTVLPRDAYTGIGGDYVIGEDGIRRPATPAA